MGVKGGGCSGLLYTLSIEDGNPTDDDRITEDKGIKILIDKKAYIYLAATELDFSDGLNGKGFVFPEPQRHQGLRLRQLLRRLAFVPQVATKSTVSRY